MRTNIANISPVPVIINTFIIALALIAEIYDIFFMDADFIINLLGLEPLHGEGGWYRETYRSNDRLRRNALPARYTADKRFATAIYYLITSDTCSALHRLSSDEVFHFYLGDPVLMLRLHPDGTGETLVLGSDIARGHHPQIVVMRGTWQGMKLIGGGQYALMGTTVAPSFDPDDFKPGDRAGLQETYPDYRELIEQLTN